MRQSTDICLLCHKKNSNKKNSHLIPKFFGKGLFEGTKPRHGMQILANGKTSRIQDIPKEDFLFCTDCEKGLSVFETYCALRLGRFDDLRHFQQFKKVKKDDLIYFECNNLDIKIFNLFIYSIIWRLSISNHQMFINFKLPIVDEEELGETIKNHIVSTQTELFDKINNLIKLPPYNHVMIRPNKKLRPPSSMFSAASLNATIHQIHLVDYLVFFITDKKELVQEFEEIDNNNLIRKVRVGLTDTKLWRSFNSDVINNMWE